MAIGTQRKVTMRREPVWGAFPTTIKAAVSAASTTVKINGVGGPNRGVATPKIGMYLIFLENLAEPAKLISAVTLNSGLDETDLTIPATVYSHAVGKEVLTSVMPNSSVLLDKFDVKINMNKWSNNSFTGTPVKATTSRRGRIEVDGSFEFQLYPTTNSQLLVRAVGQDKNIYGTDPTTAVTGILPAGAPVVAGATSFTSITLFSVGDTVQFEGNGSSSVEVHKILTVTPAATNSYTLVGGEAFTFAHAGSSTIKKVIAPFVRTVKAYQSRLDSIVIEDYLPYDDTDEASLTGNTTNSYLIPGVMLKSLKMEGQSEQGIMCSIDFDAQDKFTIPQTTNGLAYLLDAPFSFDSEVFLLDAVRNYDIMEVSFETSSDMQKRWTKDGSNRVHKLRAGQRETKGSFKFTENVTTQAMFWAAFKKDTVIAMVWMAKDKETDNYVKITIPRVIIEEFSDESVAPADLIDLELSWRALLDPTTGTDYILEIANGDWLPY